MAKEMPPADAAAGLGHNVRREVGVACLCLKEPVFRSDCGSVHLGMWCKIFWGVFFTFAKSLNPASCSRGERQITESLDKFGSEI